MKSLLLFLMISLHLISFDQVQALSEHRMYLRIDDPDIHLSDHLSLHTINRAGPPFLCQSWDPVSNSWSYRRQQHHIDIFQTSSRTFEATLHYFDLLEPLCQPEIQYIKIRLNDHLQDTQNPAAMTNLETYLIIEQGGELHQDRIVCQQVLSPTQIRQFVCNKARIADLQSGSSLIRIERGSR